MATTRKVSCNVENVRKLADALEQGKIRHERRKVGFHMAWWKEDDTVDYAKNHCGTVACIGGSAELYFKADDARTVLGLSPNNASKLFFPGDTAVVDYYAVTPKAAVEVLRHLASKGKIDWPRAIKLHPLVEAQS